MILEKIEHDIKGAMKAKDEMLLTTLRSMKTAIQLEANVTGVALTHDQEIKALQTSVKQRLQAADEYTKGNRTQLALTEMAEAAIIRTYLPSVVTGKELEVYVVHTILHNTDAKLGDIIKLSQLAVTKDGSIYDGKELAFMVKSKLGK